VVTQAYMLSIIKLMHYAGGAGFDVTLALLGYDSLIPRARSTLVGTFLDNPASTHLLFIDADIGFEPEQVHRLLSFDKDFTAAAYPLKALDWQSLPEHVTRDGEPLEQAGLRYVGKLCTGPELRIDGSFATAVHAGGGFQLIRRSVFERLIEAHPEKRYTNALVFAQDGRNKVPYYALFDSMIDGQTDTYLSEDYAFCQRWRDIGGEIWVDLESRLTHVGGHDFHGNFAPRARTILSKETA
jgi:hypothetical protein